MRRRFHPEAEAELNDAVDYHDEIAVIAVMQLNRKPGHWPHRKD
jgi:hypothetical protein